MNSKVYNKTSRFYAKYANAKNLPGHGKKLSTSKCTIDNLPDELLLKIIHMLDVNSLLCSACVNRKWRTLSEDNLLWNDIFKQYFNVGLKSAYKNLKRLSLADNDKIVHWKKEFFKQCHAKNRRIMSKLKVNAYTCVTGSVNQLLSKYKVNFQLSILDKKNSEHLFMSSWRNGNKCSTTIQWNSLNDFPPLHSINRISLFAIAPLVLNKGNEPMPHSPTQHSLIKIEEFYKRSVTDSFTDLGCDDTVVLKKSKSGILIAVWKDSHELAFVRISLNHHQLIHKCFFSTKETICSPPPHKVIFDDIDSHYGLHGYRCYLNLHTCKKTLFEDKFSYLSSTEVVQNGHLLMQPESFNVARLQYADMEWESDLFSGSVPHVAVLDIVLTDANDERMWTGCYPVIAQSTSSDDVLFDNQAPLWTFKCIDDEIGSVLVTFSKENQQFVPVVKIYLKSNKINQWFGTRY